MPDVYALSATFTPRTGQPTAAVLARALDAWIRVGERAAALPPLDPDRGWAHRTPDGGIVRWEVYAGASHSGRHALYELTWRHPQHFTPSPYQPTPDAPEVHWSTRVSCMVGADERASVAVRVGNTGPAANSPGVLRTSRPRFLLDLARHGALATDGVVCATRPRPLRAVDVADLVRYDLLDPERRTPVVVISPAADGSYVVAPATIGSELFTLARVYAVARPEDTFALTDALGRRELSAFAGAMRVYLPGLTRDANPLEHPLLVARRLSDRTVRHELASYLALRTPERFADDPQFAILRDERAAHEDAARRAVEADLRRAAGAAREAADFQGLAELYAQENARLLGEIDALRARLDDAAARVRDLDDERRRLAYRLRGWGTVGEAAEVSAADAPALPQPATVVDAVDQAAELFANDLLLLPRAWDSAEDSNYSDPAAVLAAMQALAGIAARRASAEGLRQSLRDACAAEGLEYRAAISTGTPKKLRRQYEIADEEGHVYFCPEHLVLGTSYNPEHLTFPPE